MTLFLYIYIVSVLTFSVALPPLNNNGNSQYNTENLRIDPTNSPLLNRPQKHSYDQLVSDNINTHSNYVQFIKMISYSSKGPDSAKDGPDDLYVTPKLMNSILSLPNQFSDGAKVYETKILQITVKNDNELKSSTNNAINGIGFYVYDVDGHVLGKLVEPSEKSFNSDSNNNLPIEKHELNKRGLVGDMMTSYATSKLNDSLDSANSKLNDTLDSATQFANQVKNTSDQVQSTANSIPTLS